MIIPHSADTDTLSLELINVARSSQTRDLDANTLVDLNDGGAVCAITIEHASERPDGTDPWFEQLPPDCRKVARTDNRIRALQSTSSSFRPPREG
jgi:uncharacterized protein YuzE